MFLLLAWQLRQRNWKVFPRTDENIYPKRNPGNASFPRLPVLRSSEQFLSITTSHSCLSHRQLLPYVILSEGLYLLWYISLLTRLSSRERPRNYRCLGQVTGVLRLVPCRPRFSPCDLAALTTVQRRDRSALQSYFRAKY